MIGVGPVSRYADEEDGFPPFDLDRICAELAALGVPATVEQTGGGTATLYAGEPVYDPDEERYEYPVSAGPGHFVGPGWSVARSYREEFSFGPNDQDAESCTPPDDATEADVARLIADLTHG